MSTGYDILATLAGGNREMTDAMIKVSDVDEQSGELLAGVGSKLSKILDISEADAEGLRRFIWVIENAGKASPDLIRNNVFKAANALGMKLPSGMF